ncbi:PilT domain-containing protein [mine drainage metagenome]|uniref:PilT domain-containing protein n=1 Tax=mine drainage metagenome TaxID=410659 RepID=T0ZSG9_9ZZZZ
MPVFFDTNVLVYLFDESEPLKKAVAQQLLETEVAAGNAVISTQVLQEFYVAVTRKLTVPLPLEVAERALCDLSVLPVQAVDTHLILAAVRRNQTDALSFWDALIVETALSSGAQRLYSEDLQDGREIGGLRIENPFPKEAVP